MSFSAQPFYGNSVSTVLVTSMTKKLILAVLVTTVLTACNSNGKVVPQGASYKKISYGRVIEREVVTLGGTNTGIGAYAGSLAAVNDATSRSFVGFLVRGLAGSIVGAAAEEAVTRKSGMLYTVETTRGDILEIATKVKDVEVGSCIEFSKAGRQRVSVSQAPAGKCGTIKAVN